MDIKQAIKAIDSRGVLSTTEGLSVLVDILDAKAAYGAVRLKVRGAEVDGAAAWVDASRIAVVEARS